MAEEQVAGSVKGNAGRQGSPRKRSSARKGGSKTKRAAQFKLTGTNVDEFWIGDSAVDVVLTGEGLNTDGLRAMIHDLDPADVVVIEQPSPDHVLPDEFPITVQVVKAIPGKRHFAVTTVPPTDKPNVGKTYILKDSIEFKI